jgi:hypothetical protein
MEREGMEKIGELIRELKNSCKLIGGEFRERYLEMARRRNRLGERG